MPSTILSEVSATVSELKKNPMGVVASGNGYAVAIIHDNKPAFYCIPAEAYETLIDMLDDLELNAIANARKNEKAVKVNLNNLA